MIEFQKEGVVESVMSKRKQALLRSNSPGIIGPDGDRVIYRGGSLPPFFLMNMSLSVMP